MESGHLVGADGFLLPCQIKKLPVKETKSKPKN